MEIEALKRYSAAEIVLLGIFALGLALSALLVKIRSRVQLDMPVELPLAGIAAPLPMGIDWETAGGWRYENDNAFVLLGRMQFRGRTAITVRWRYILCDEPKNPSELLQLQAKIMSGRLESLGAAPGAVKMQYGRIYAPSESGEEFLVGIASLDFNRRLELHISYLGDADYAHNTFRLLAAAVTYDCPEHLAAGASFMQQFNDGLLNLHLKSAAQSETTFLIKDAAQRPLGYAVRRFFVYDSSEDGHRRITTRRLDASGVYIESDLWLTDADGTMSWTTQTWTPRSRQPNIAELRADATGRLTVQTGDQRQRTIYRTPMMLPEIFLPECAAELLKIDDGEIVIDVVTGSGMVVPTRLAKIAPDQSPIRSEKTVFIVRAEYLHTNNAFDDFVFDSAGVMLARFEQEPRRLGLLWDIVSPEQLQQIFGERFESRSRQAVWLQSTSSLRN